MAGRRARSAHCLLSLGAGVCPGTLSCPPGPANLCPSAPGAGLSSPDGRRLSVCSPAGRLGPRAVLGACLPELSVARSAPPGAWARRLCARLEASVKGQRRDQTDSGIRPRSLPLQGGGGRSGRPKAHCPHPPTALPPRAALLNPAAFAGGKAESQKSGPTPPAWPNPGPHPARGTAGSCAQTCTLRVGASVFNPRAVLCLPLKNLS